MSDDFSAFTAAALFAKLQTQRALQAARADHDTQRVIEAAVADVIALPGIRPAAETAQRALDLLAEHGMSVARDDVLVEVVLQLGGK